MPWFARRSLVLVALLALSGCAMLPALMGVTPPPPPVAVADRTTLDEQGALAVELAYQAQAQVIVVAARAGLFDAATKERLRDLDNRAYRAVLATRAAYRAGNAADYFAAAAEARGAISQTLEAVKGAGR